MWDISSTITCLTSPETSITCNKEVTDKDTVKSSKNSKEVNRCQSLKFR